jgi:hypothetical protein
MPIQKASIPKLIMLPRYRNIRILPIAKFAKKRGYLAALSAGSAFF